ncbi:MAG TPA: hypothetical protein VH600_00250 [Burkholderiales bacterium]|jgi:hypothetical protein
MAKGSFLSLLANAAVAAAAIVLLYLIIRALWDEIGPMVRLILHRDRVVAIQDDQDAGLKR